MHYISPHPLKSSQYLIYTLLAQLGSIDPSSLVQLPTHTGRMMMMMSY